MVRTYVKKTERAHISEETVKNAISSAINDKKSITEAAKHFGLKPTMLYNRVSKFRILNMNAQGEICMINLIIILSEANMLHNRCLQASRNYF